jgi:hypothetical protein
MQRLLLIFAMLGVAIASAKSYNVKLFQPAMLGGVQLAPGEYRLEMVGSNVVLKNGKVEAQSPGREETVDAKYPSTTVRFDNTDGKMRIREIFLGGTNTKLVLTGEGGD